MPDVDKLFEKAEKYLQKQKFESALETYLEIYKLQPRDEEVLLNLSDLSLRLNRTADGLRYHTQLADFYIQRNDSSKAMATCRKILKLAPQDVATMMKLGALYEKSKKNPEALETYRQALALHLNSGATLQAIECLDHIVKLDPANLNDHIELGELASRAGQAKTAAPAYLTAARLAREREDENRWAELVERAHAIDPGNEAGCVAAAEVNLKKGDAAAAVSLLEPVVQAQPDDLEVMTLLVRSYMQAAEYAKAEPLCWKIYAQRPEAVDLVRQLAEGLVQTGQTDKVLALASQLRGALVKQGKKNDYLQIIEKIYDADESNLQVLEMLSKLYDELNREDGLRRSLVRLFNLYLAAEQYEKAAETLERIIDVDPYGEGHGDRLLNLEGYIDKIWYENIASRLQLPSTHAPSGVAAADKRPSTKEGLDDLVIEGEMFLQYQLTSKLTGTIEKIQRLYPGAEEDNQRLRDLYNAAGFHPGSRAAPGGRPAPAAAAARLGEAPRPQPAAPAAQRSLDEVRRISEITANLYRESTGQGVLQAAVNEIGRSLSSSRCWGALGTPDRPPSLIVEYCSPMASASDLTAALKLYSQLMRQATNKPDGWAMEDVAQFPVVASIMPDIQKLGIQSLLALPLMDKEEPAGMLLVEQCQAQRTWTPGEIVFLSALATQIVVAVNNTKLRRLVRSLAGTDEETGLLPRSSYLDCLLSEASRANTQAAALSVCLLEPEDPAGLLKRLGDAGLKRYLQQVAKAMQSSLRQNDIAIRYTPCALAVVFSDTALPQGGLAVEKLRRVIGQIKADASPSPNFCAVVCDVFLAPNFDPVDGVTEVINRLEKALDACRKEGGKRVFLSKFEG
jgi:tetratricopeptide (TPR) repeat protein/GGDEF domain-containing protein